MPTTEPMGFWDCTHCGDVAQIVRYRAEGGVEFIGCGKCLHHWLEGRPMPSVLQPPAEDSLPSGEERLSRAVEELAREVRLTRNLFAEFVTDRIESELRESADGGDASTEDQGS